MLISQMIARLQDLKSKYGDVDCMFQEPNSCEGPFSVDTIDFRVAGKNEYPEEFDMPEGFEFVEIGN